MKPEHRLMPTPVIHGGLLSYILDKGRACHNSAPESSSNALNKLSKAQLKIPTAFFWLKTSSGLLTQVSLYYTQEEKYFPA